MVKRILNKHGYRFDTSPRPSDALALARSARWAFDCANSFLRFPSSGSPRSRWRGRRFDTAPREFVFSPTSLTRPAATLPRSRERGTRARWAEDGAGAGD